MQKYFAILLILTSLIAPGSPISSTQMPKEAAQTPQPVQTQPVIQQSSMQTYTVTAYTLRQEECGKAPDHPLYGVTTSGVRAKVGVTIAAGPDVPMGAKIYLPELAWLNGTGLFEVQDRGGAIKEGCIDVYFGDPEVDPECVGQALDFGRQELEGEVLE